MKCGPKPLDTKVCPICGIDKPRSEYYKKLDTISHKCKPCTLEQSKKTASKYFGKYTEYQNSWRSNRYQSDETYRAKIALQKHILYQSKKDVLNAARRLRWANDQNNPARKYYRRKDVKNRTPKWVDLNEILEVYSKCPKGYEVDHIIPLKGLIDGRPVTGLHVVWNLQYLTPTANRKKSNRITEDSLSQII